MLYMMNKLPRQEPFEIEDTSCQNLSPGTPPVEVCSLEQNQDCVVTEYSNWTACCGRTQRRTRSIVIEQKNDGAKCPPVQILLLLAISFRYTIFDFITLYCGVIIS